MDNKIKNVPYDIKYSIYNFIPTKYCSNCFCQFKSFDKQFCCKYCNIQFLFNILYSDFLISLFILWSYFIFIYLLTCTICIYLILIFMIVKITHDYIL